MKDKIIKGFTLVEVIVVMVILAILAAMFVPSLTKYIEKADDTNLVAEGRQWFVAAQAAATESYGRDAGSFRTAYDKTGTSYQIVMFDDDGNELPPKKVKAIRISNALYSLVQCYGELNDETMYKLHKKKDYNGLYYKTQFAADILDNMDCLNDKSSFDFVSTQVYGGTYTNANAYFNGNKGDITLNVYVDRTGSVIMIQYAKRGCDKTIEYSRNGYRLIDNVNKT